MRGLVIHSHPLEDNFSAALRDAVCDGLSAGAIDHTVIRLSQGDEPDLAGQQYDQLVAVCPTWWGGPPAVMLDWLQRTLGPHVDGNESASPSPLASIRRLSVVTTHGSSRLMNRMQGEPGRQTWARVVMPMCAPRAEFEWISLYKIDRSTESGRARFLDRVRTHFTSDRVPG